MLGLDFRNWIGGLISAVVTGGSTAVVSIMGLNVIDPGHFDMQDPDIFKTMGLIFGVNGALAFFNFLKQSPLPKGPESTKP